jgi:hypothetical protein
LFLILLWRNAREAFEEFGKIGWVEGEDVGNLFNRNVFCCSMPLAISIMRFSKKKQGALSVVKFDGIA